MELVKINEQYKLTDTTEIGWIVEGNVTKNTTGEVLIYFNVVSAEGERLGNMNYRNNIDNTVSVNYHVVDSHKDIFKEYSNNLVSEIKTYFE